MPYLKNNKIIPGSVLVDKRNFALIKDELIARMRAASLIGFDLETHDKFRHDGLNRAMKVSEDGHKGGNTKLLFDTQRTVVTGFSLFLDGDDRAYYFNLAHADEANRLHFWDDKVFEVLMAKQKDAYWIAHKAPYELTFMETGWGAEMEYRIGFPLGENIICSMQMAVTAFNEDTYPIDLFQKPGLGGIDRLFPAVKKVFGMWEPGMPLTNEMDELVMKVTAKESTAEHSYNGYVNSIKFTYGLKKLAMRFLGYEQTTFDEVMAGRPHMGCLTGEEVAAYGADDAWVAVYLYHELMAFLMKENPQVIPVFFSQENPMVHVYSEVWREGVRIDLQQVKRRKEEERVKIASTLSKMKKAIKGLLPFPEDIHEKLIKYDPKGYGKEADGKYVTALKYREQVTAWANTEDYEDPFQEVYRVKTSVSKQWAADKGLKESSGISLTYYQVVRCIVLDLMRGSFQLAEGKILSDAEALDKMKSRMIKKAEEQGVAVFDKEKKEYLQGDNGVYEGVDYFNIFLLKLEVFEQYEALKATDQAIKLYLAPYENLTDPETCKVHPILSSNLNSRRMAMESPNLNQLAKFTSMAYVREFFLADTDEEVIVTADYSAIELLLIGEASGDKRFKWAYGQLPHQDIHSLTASSLIGITLEDFKLLPNKKQLRTELGKPANFGYWFSGGLGTVAKELGWTSEQMWEYVEKYRAQFPEAEQWRLETIAEAQRDGKVRLPDQHLRYRLESTPFWGQIMRMKFGSYGPVVENFGNLCIKKIQRRSGNQAVNSKIQGSGGTLAKRSCLAMRERIKEGEFRARFMFPTHDELAFTVHKKDAVRFSEVLREVMCHQPEIIKNLKLAVSVAIGRNYGGWSKSNPLGQIECDEASKVPFLPEERWGEYMTMEERQKTVDYLFSPEAVA